MKSPDKVIEVLENTSLAELVEEILSSREEILRLVVPEGYKVLKSEVALRLLKEKTISARKKIVVVTDDETIKISVAKAGFLVKPLNRVRPGSDYFETLAAKTSLKVSDISPVKQSLDGPRRVSKTIEVKKEEVPKKKISSRAKKAVEPKVKEIEPGPEKIIPEPQPEAQVDSWMEDFQDNRQPEEVLAVGNNEGRKKKLLFLLGFFVAVVIIFVLASSFVFPSAKVIITPKRQFENISFDVEASAAAKQVVSFGPGNKSILPGQYLRLEREVSAVLPSSGRQFVEESARGIIQVFNAYSSSPQTLVANTRFLSPDGKIFRLTKQIVVPGAKVEEGKIIPNSIDAEVVAEGTGESYNIGPTTFSIPGFQGSPKFNGFYGKSNSPIGGGFTGEVSVVTEEDLNRARQQLEQRVFDILEQEWQTRIPSDLKVIAEAKVKKVEEFRSPLKAGSRAQNFEAVVKGSLSLMAFREKDLEQVVGDRLAVKLTQATFIENTEGFMYSEPLLDASKQTFSASVETKATIASRVEVDKLAKKVLGQDESEIRSILASESGIERAKITLWPFWSGKAPSDLDKIKVEVD
ncbi:hypothetical protein C4553_01970 [Candidatus Parcubacteria bacterium]|nr:MAG: hypothetical protein C4553_01970 [Candidatus Parcubacteria bacterium]